MLFGLAQKGKVSDELEAKLETVNQLDNSSERNLEHIRDIDEKNQVLAQANNEKAVNERKKVAIKYSLGDFVIVKNFDRTAGVARKLIPKTKGAYEIFKVLKNDRYILKDVDGFQLARNPYQGVWSAHNMKPWIKI